MIFFFFGESNVAIVIIVTIITDNGITISVILITTILNIYFAVLSLQT